MLGYATTSALRKERRNETAKAVDLALNSPEKVLSAVKHSDQEKYTPDEAVALFIVNGKQSKQQYQMMRSAAQWKRKPLWNIFISSLRKFPFRCRIIPHLP